MWTSLLLSSLCLFLQSLAQECSDGAIRLRQTTVLTTSNSGRLEVCREGVWGTVRGSGPTEFWPTKNVDIACSQLNFITGLNSVPSIQISDPDSSSLPIHFGNVVCDGTEQFLSDCQSLDVSDSAHNSDVYIVCLPGSEPYSGLNTLPFGVSVTEGDLRLVGSTANGHGAVEIYTRLGWSSICPDDEWTNSDAAVICQRLGYGSGRRDVFTLQEDEIESRNVGDARCSNLPSGSSNTFRVSAGFCSFRDTTSVTCSASPDLFAGVVCSSSPDQSIRLFNQISESDRVTGILEIVYDGRWGLLCGPTDANNVAESVCQGLGFGRSSGLFTVNNLQGVESRQKPMWIPDVSCNSESQSLEECNFVTPIGFGACTNVLAVDCEDPPYMLPGYGIALIVLSVLAVVGLVVWWFTHGRMIWEKRRSYSNYNKCMSCLDSCLNACKNPTCPRRSRNFTPAAPSSNRGTSSSTAPAPVPQPTPPDPEPAAEPEPEEVLQNAELLNPPPPSYGASASLPPPTDELPPPYSGPSPQYPVGGYPPVNPAYPPGNPAYPPNEKAYSPGTAEYPLPPGLTAVGTVAFPPPGTVYPPESYPPPDGPGYPT